MYVCACMHAYECIYDCICMHAGIPYENKWHKKLT